MQEILEWLTTLPAGTLYGVLVLAGVIENIIPPFPSDVVVAFTSFLLAQGDGGTLVGAFIATWTGNVGSALLVYVLGRRYGAERLERRLAGRHAESWDARLRKMFERFGLPAIFLSRFLPGVRAIVPAFAGALRLSPLWTAVMIAVASALWYGLITSISFRVGADWEQLNASVARVGTTAAIVAGAILLVGIGAWVLARRGKSG